MSQLNSVFVIGESRTNLDTTEQFLKKIFLGRNFYKVGEDLEEVLNHRYGGSSRKAVLVFYRDTLKRIVP